MTLYLKAYQAYSLKNYDHCLKLLHQIEQEDTKKLDLLAQVYFQKREYQKAHQIYQGLSSCKDEFTNEREENMSVLIACAQLEQPGSLKAVDLPNPSDIVDQVQQICLIDTEVVDIFAKTKSRKQRKRKTKLPKSYNPNIEPDPERWLPMRDRKGAAHRQKNKRRQRANPKGKGRGR